ncbi:ATP-binding protein [Pseudomonas gingeri]|uniref:ATP-binding protein n=1 Tax=Pseudomonas gingeri TaxID=117681 RepID=UPI00210D2585|nr:winged helix-turn-helix domain-containing protein [Pseudomonas gingeri]
MKRDYRFGRFEVRPAERRLYVDSRPVALGARAFDVLLALIERRERMVSKSELLELVWPNLFVEENNLQVQVSTLRKVLGMQAVVTVTGQGYRFAMALEERSLPPAEAVPGLSTSLPAAPRKLIGRDQELVELLELVQAYPLVSIVGAAGIGKSAFALTAAHRLKPAIWVELSAITDPEQLVLAVACALMLPIPTSEPLAELLLALASLDIVLILDGAEHLLEAIARLAWLIGEKAPRIRLLITSQAALRVESERVFRLGGLPVPGIDMSADEAMQYAAVMLFADQAQALDRTFRVTPQNVAAVISVCRQLNGMALPIKLAAARLPLLGVRGVASRLGERLEMLNGLRRGGNGGRQQTLGAGLEWSYSLLSPVEQTLLRRCAVFVGGFTLELATAVCAEITLDKWAAINALDALVDRSLVEVQDGPVRRYQLCEYVCEYAMARLDRAGETGFLRHRHALSVTELMIRAYEAYWRAADKSWLEEYAADTDNVRAALDWSQDHQPELALKLLGVSGPLFFQQGLVSEGRQRFLSFESVAMALMQTLVLEISPFDLETLLARYWLEFSRLHTGSSTTRSAGFSSRALVFYRSLGDQCGVFLALCRAMDSAVLPSCEARCILEEIIEIECADWPPRLRAERLLAEVILYQRCEQPEDASFALESLQLLALSAGLESTERLALNGQAKLNLAKGEYECALQRSQALCAHRGTYRNIVLPHALATMAMALLSLEKMREARKVLADFVCESRSLGWEWFGLYTDLFVWLATLESRIAVAARLMGYAKLAYDPAGARDFNMTRIRVRISHKIYERLDKSFIARLMTEGARMDREMFCTLALSRQTVGLDVPTVSDLEG